MSRTVAISGESGLIGGALATALRDRGDRVLKLVRREASAPDEVCWDWVADRFEAEKLAAIDAVVHLAGKNIAARWSDESRVGIWDSREKGTQLLTRGLLKLESPPKMVISASAIGYYGYGRCRQIDDDSQRGEGWMADLCAAWEAAATPLAEAGIRLVQPRIGIVLTPEGGALEQMLTPFRLGVGGRLADGEQGMSWIGLSDIVKLLLTAIDDERYHGPMNATAPQPVSNADFTRTLGRVLRRPTIFPVPSFVVRLIWGEMGQRLMLDGDYIQPTNLLRLGFQFDYPELEASLRHELHER